MTLAYTPFTVKILDYATPTEACPDCGTVCKRHARASRFPADIDIDLVVLLKIIVGVYICNVCGKAFTDVLKENGITISMDGKGRAMDNIMIERLWRTVKYEEVYPRDYASVLDLIVKLDRYFEYYNAERPHEAFGLQTPAEAYVCGSRDEEAA
jgi:hypothetical protein